MSLLTTNNRLSCAVLALAAVLACSAVASGQTEQSQPKQGNQAQSGNQAHSPWKFYPTDRAVGDGGPAPKRDLTGTWAGPGSGSAIPRGQPADKPSLTPLGQQLMTQNKPLQKFSPAGTNDPHVRYCDPFGFPQNMVNEIRGLSFTTMPNRIIVLLQYQDLWREIWTDGRALPKDPDPSWLGYSVGHWEGETFVVETIGFNDKEWVDLYGNPRTSTTHLTERYRRLNHDTLEQQIIIDDPRVYTKPWVSPPKLHKLEPGWEIAEWFCVLDENKGYDDAVRKPAGIAPASK